MEEFGGADGGNHKDSCAGADQYARRYSRHGGIQYEIAGNPERNVQLLGKPHLFSKAATRQSSRLKSINLFKTWARFRCQLPGGEGRPPCLQRRKVPRYLSLLSIRHLCVPHKRPRQAQQRLHFAGRGLSRRQGCRRHRLRPRYRCRPGCRPTRLGCSRGGVVRALHALHLSGGVVRMRNVVKIRIPPVPPVVVVSALLTETVRQKPAHVCLHVHRKNTKNTGGWQDPRTAPPGVRCIGSGGSSRSKQPAALDLQDGLSSSQAVA